MVFGNLDTYQSQECQRDQGAYRPGANTGRLGSGLWRERSRYVWFLSLCHFGDRNNILKLARIASK
jgi:hypothetical protein